MYSSQFTYWRPRAGRDAERGLWEDNFATSAGALADIFKDFQIDIDEWARLMYGTKEEGFPTMRGGAMWHEELQIVRAIYTVFQPTVAVEVGTFRGASLRAARELHVPEHHYVFDIDPQVAAYVPAGVIFVKRDEHGPLNLPAAWDVGTLDDGHAKGCTRRWLDTLAQSSHVESVLIVHDMREESCGGDDREAVTSFLRDKQGAWKGWEIRTPCGLAILRRKA